MNCYSFVGNCPSCRRAFEYLNIRNDHWAYCDPCRIKEFVGKDLFPSWRVETEAIWQANAEKIRDYQSTEKENRTSELPGSLPETLFW